MGTPQQPVSSVPISGTNHEQWIVADVAGKRICWRLQLVYLTFVYVGFIWECLTISMFYDLVVFEWQSLLSMPCMSELMILTVSLTTPCHPSEMHCPSYQNGPVECCQKDNGSEAAFVTDFALDSLDQSIEIVCRWLVRPWHTLHKGRMIALFENLSSLQVESKKYTQKSPYWISEPSAHLTTNLGSTVLQDVLEFFCHAWELWNVLFTTTVKRCKMMYPYPLVI